MKKFKQSQSFQNSVFVFAHYQRQGESDPGGYIKRGVIYHHGWGTGYQELIFENHEDAANWWKAECNRLSKKVA